MPRWPTPTTCEFSNLRAGFIQRFSACMRRACARARSTGRPLLPYAPGGRCRAHRPHRPWCGCHV
jgi:hypothetical protein